MVRAAWTGKQFDLQGRVRLGKFERSLRPVTRGWKPDRSCSGGDLLVYVSLRVSVASKCEAAPNDPPSYQHKPITQTAAADT